MLIYVAHMGGSEDNVNRAKSITKNLAVFDTSNTYICPLLAFSHLSDGDIGKFEEIEQHKDLLCVCDMVMIASEVTDDMREELELAEKLHMEVVFYEGR